MGLAFFSSIIAEYTIAWGFPDCNGIGSPFAGAGPPSDVNGETEGLVIGSDGWVVKICAGCRWMLGACADMGVSSSPSACLACMLFGLIANTRWKQYSRRFLSEKQKPNPNQPCSENGSSFTSRANSLAASSRSPALAEVNAAWSNASLAIALLPYLTPE